MDKKLPDIVNKIKSNYFFSINKVGMENIEIPLSLVGTQSFTKGIVDIYVNLIDKRYKGIHMSRLYLLLVENFKKNKFSFANLLSLHQELCASQSPHSNKSFLNVKIEYPLLRQSLISKFSAYRFYPITIYSEYDQKKIKLEFEIDIVYSSTCPCSASLSSEAIKNDFLDKISALKTKKEIAQFAENYNFMQATPHAQRSLAKVRFQLKKEEFDFKTLSAIINQIETAIATPVQAVVKRKDEQQFAILNAENLMFCEDAYRVIKNYFTQEKIFSKHSIKVVHYESLHAHNAVATSD